MAAQANGYQQDAAGRIVAASRARVLLAPTLEQADPMDRLAVVMGDVADAVRANRCPALRDGGCPALTPRRAEGPVWLRAVKGIGPWGVLSLFALWLLARETGFRFSGLFGTGG